MCVKSLELKDRLINVLEIKLSYGKLFVLVFIVILIVCLFVVLLFICSMLFLPVTQALLT